MSIRSVIACLLVLVTVLCASVSCRGSAASDPTNPGDTSGDLNISFACQLLLAEINASRRAAGLDDVELDATATESAQAHADEMAAMGYLSHLDSNGLNPVERYNIAGGWEPSYENAWRKRGDANLDLDAVKKMHADAMGSALHRDNVLTPDHTHVGIGFHYDAAGDALYGVELFTSRHAYSVGIDSRECSVGESVGYLASFDPDEVMFTELLLARGGAPLAQTAAWLNANPHYDLPDDYIALYVETGADNVTLPGAVRRAVLEYDRASGMVSGDVLIEQGWQPGVYYLYTWGRYTDSRSKVLLSMLTVNAG